MAKTRLLLVEDDEDDYIITRDLLADIDPSGYQLVWVSNRESAVQNFQQGEYDICLMDYTLGAFTGLELLTEAKQLGFQAPVIMLTGHDDSALDADALSAGAVDYLVKTQLNAARLSRAIRYAIARRDMERERLQRLQAQAENQSKSEFLAHLSHEIRTPLTSILGYTDVLLQAQTNQQAQAHLNIIKRNGQHLLSLLNDVLDLSKIEADRLELQISAVPVAEFLSDVHQLMVIRAQDKGIGFTISALTELPTSIQSDPTRLRQILLNLLSNAIKFTDQGEVNLVVGADIANAHCTLNFAVHDTGVGISETEMARLFQPFTQVKGGQNRFEQGTGLGLAISQQLASRLGGRIHAASQLGRGSCFTFSLNCPLSAGASAETWALQTQSRTPLDSFERLDAKILVADDLADIRELIAHLLSSAGARVSQVSNGEQAVAEVLQARAQGQPFDVIVMDVQMPVVDGLAATQQLRAQGITTPIIALTAQTMRGERQRCLDAGCNDHLGKPVQSKRLVDCIRQHLSAEASIKAPTNKTTIGKTLLLVEDDRDAREATQLLLASLGWEVSVCECAAQALSHCATQKPSLILVDINLPDMTGFALAKKLRKLTPASHLLAATGAVPDADVLAASDFDGAIEKPFDLERLAKL
ncbi:response regulator [Simiduia curdlanivorans]|uniref:histidine kinase n=1 Tax=Simiduia curdlanivorans TaxID=1492769 RepID=A0ABV8V2M0_9GAMM|nr:hybrid sensor histidine kinase/response regulator [Simiduia curdlanivorans]MDN3641045.1 response regulator [Simiduia curdlanivorans]